MHVTVNLEGWRIKQASSRAQPRLCKRAERQRTLRAHRRAHRTTSGLHTLTSSSGSRGRHAGREPGTLPRVSGCWERLALCFKHECTLKNALL